MSGTPPNSRPAGEVLFVANTRPAAPGGVPMELAIGAIATLMILSLVLRNPLWMLLLAPTWLALRIYASKDLHIANTVIGWLGGAGHTPNRSKWGGSTVAPLCSPSSSRFGIFR